MGQTFDCLWKGIEFTQSHRPEEAIPDSYDKFEPRLSLVPTCRKNRGLSPSGVCECILHKLKYGTNI